MAGTPTGWRKAPWYAPDARLEPPETSGLEASVRIPLGKPPKKHAHSVALFAMYYNFVRIHKTLRMTPAMAAGVTDRLWEIGDVVTLVEAMDTQPGKRGPTKRWT